MKILIIGNIGSGKTTLGKKIQEIMGYKFVQIDELREEYLEKKVSEEYYCLYEFLKAIEDNNDVILEFTGAGCHKFAIKRALELTNDNIIILHCKNRDFSLILERSKHKELNKNFPFETDIEKHITFIKEELDNKSLEDFWNIRGSIFINVYMDTPDDLTESFKRLLKKINKLRK